MLKKNEKAVVWSKQQQDFLTWCEKGHGSCILVAVAGAGKSTTMVEGARIIPGNCALMAYNKSAGKELQAKLDEKKVPWQKAQAGTAHSFGFAAYRKSFSRVTVDGEKVSKLMAPYCERNEHMAKYESKIRMLVSQAKQRALGVIGNISDDQPWFDIIEHFDMADSDEEGKGVDPLWLIVQARQFLLISNKKTDVIDFDDMIYLPLLLRLRFFRYDNVMMDEAQDTNPARRALMAAMLKPGGRAIAVGDPRQAIYGFTGADNDSLDLIKKDFMAKEMPLTVSYRCPKAVVAFAQAWVSHIQPHQEAPAGRISQCDEKKFYDRLDGDETNPEFTNPRTTAILCRLTKPLVQLAFSLIRKKIACKVEGRDIGNQIVKLVYRWKVKDTAGLEQKLNDYLEKETTKLLAKKQEQKLALVEDMVETVKVIIHQCNLEKKYAIADVTNYVNALFDDDVKGVLTLSTIHKAKGREWRTVYWLNRQGTCPSPWARQQWQMDQENNLCYVAATRSQHELVELTVSFKKEERKNQTA